MIVCNQLATTDFIQASDSAFSKEYQPWQRQCEDGPGRGWCCVLFCENTGFNSIFSTQNASTEELKFFKAV